MRVFVAGATGAVGSRLVPLLVAAGHHVIGLTRTAAKAEKLRQAGAEPVIADALDGAAIRQAVITARPEIIAHELTSLSEAIDLSRFDQTFAVSNRLRTEGLDHLVAGAKAAGTRRIVAQSYCGWPYARVGGPVKTEGDPLDPSPPRQQRRSLDAIRYLERTVTGNPDVEGVVLRYGAFYGPRTGMFDQSAIDQVRRRRVPLIGDGGGWWSFLHVDDAAAATLAAIERGSPDACNPSVYNIVDDDPAPVSEWLPALATMLGARPPWHVPRWLARLVAGDHVVAMMTESRAGSNAKAKRDLVWQPAYPSWREGFAEIIARG